MSELKKCPFCGGEVEVKSRSSNFFDSVFEIVCRECGCRQAPSIHKEAVINAWNTRKPMDNIVQKLEELPYGRSYHDYAEKGIVHKYLERNDVLDIVKQEINNGLE